MSPKQKWILFTVKTAIPTTGVPLSFVQEFHEREENKFLHKESPNF